LPVEGSLRLVVGDYVLDYDLIGNTVAITAIRHGRQLDPEFVDEDDLDGEQLAVPRRHSGSGPQRGWMETTSSHFPGHAGLRFSANALRPSLASSVIAKSAIWLSV
jgi:hypothetical protein